SPKLTAGQSVKPLLRAYRWSRHRTRNRCWAASIKFQTRRWIRCSKWPWWTHPLRRIDLLSVSELEHELDIERLQSDTMGWRIGHHRSDIAVPRLQMDHCPARRRQFRVFDLQQGGVFFGDADYEAVEVDRQPSAHGLDEGFFTRPTRQKR